MNHGHDFLSNFCILTAKNGENRERSCLILVSVIDCFLFKLNQLHGFWLIYHFDNTNHDLDSKNNNVSGKF